MPNIYYFLSKELKGSQSERKNGRHTHTDFSGSISIVIWSEDDCYADVAGKLIEATQMKQQIKYLTSRKVRGRIVPSLATVFNLFSLILLQFFGERPSKLTAAGESKKEAKGRNVCIRAMTSVFLVVVASNFWMFETTTEENEEKKHNGTEDKIFANNCKDRNELVEQKKKRQRKIQERVVRF